MKECAEPRIYFKYVLTFLLLSNMEGIEALLVEAEALPLVNGGGGGSPRELQLIVELATKW